MTRPLNVTVLMDVAAIPQDDPDFTGDSIEPTTERHVTVTLRELGHHTRILGVGDDVQEIMTALSQHKPDLVFNLTEQFADNRQLDKNVAGLMEMMNIPFTGTGATGLMLCRDKGLCKELLSFHHVRVPRFIMLRPGKKPRLPAGLPFPLIVKPTLEDGSDGISLSSVVHNPDELHARAQYVHDNWHQVAIAEEYIEGRELYVGVLGNARLTVLPPRGIDFGELAGRQPTIATASVKHDSEYRDKWKIHYGPAQLTDADAARVARICKRIYRLLRMRDFGRIDLRITSEGRIVFLEANPNPDIAYGDEVAEAAHRAGIDYEPLIDKIIHLALRRYK